MVDTLNYDPTMVNDLNEALKASVETQFPGDDTIKIDWSQTSRTFLDRLHEHGYVITRQQEQQG